MIALLQILGIVFIGLLISILLKKDKPEITFFLILLLCIFISLHILSLFQSILQELGTFGEYLQENTRFLAILMKMIGLTYLCELSANICKDYGYSAIGNQIEVLGKVLVIVIGLPVLRATVEMLESVLK